MEVIVLSLVLIGLIYIVVRVVLSVRESYGRFLGDEIGLERAIVRVAKADGGIVSPPAVIAMYSNWSMLDVQKMLDHMVSKGHIDQVPTKSGNPPLAYVVTSFLTEENSRGLIRY